MLIHQYYCLKSKTDQTKNKYTYDFVQMKECDKTLYGELTSFKFG